MLPLMSMAAEFFPGYCAFGSCASAGAQEVVAEHSGNSSQSEHFPVPTAFWAESSPITYLFPHL